jgi:hypothetical protein
MIPLYFSENKTVSKIELLIDNFGLSYMLESRKYSDHWYPLEEAYAGESSFIDK